MHTFAMLCVGAVDLGNHSAGEAEGSYNKRGR
jgi:hypothetical protein